MSEAEKELEEAVARLKIEVISAAGDAIKALTPVFREASKVVKALVKIAREGQK